MTPINFKANFLKTVYVPRKGKEETEMSIVSLDKNNQEDMIALRDVAKEWNSKATTFAFEIYQDAIKEYQYNDVVKEHYLAITQQNQDYAHLTPDKIVGLALYSEKNEPQNEISWLQTDPNNNTANSNQSREYKGIGRIMINYIKSITDKPLFVQSADNAIEFYKKQDFKASNPSQPSKLIWDT